MREGLPACGLAVRPSAQEAAVPERERAEDAVARSHEAIAGSSGPEKPRAALLSAGGLQDSTMVVKRCR